MSNGFTDLPALNTERLLLRQLTDNDAGEVMILRSDPEVNKYIGRTGTINRDEAVAFIEKINLGIKEKATPYWAITMTPSDKLIGTICLWNFSADHSGAEIGFELSPAYQRKGIMQEAASRVLRFAFQELKLQLITGFVEGGNTASIKLLEKLGFIKDVMHAIIPEERTDGLDVYYLKPSMLSTSG